MKIAFYRGVQPGLAALFDYAVHWWCAGPYSHAVFVAGTAEDGVSCLASSTALGKGVGYQQIILTDAEWDVYEVPGNIELARAWFEMHIGQGYDYIGLIRYVMPRGDGEKCKWYCSEAVAAMMGLDQPWRFDPNMLACMVRNEFQKVSLPLKPSKIWEE